MKLLPRTALLLALGSLSSLTIVSTASAQILAVYDPVGTQTSNMPVPATSVIAPLTASGISQMGFGNWMNTNVWPVGQIGSASPTVDPNQYLEFEIFSIGVTEYSRLSYSRRSYTGEGNRQAAVRTSLDNFAANVATVTGLNPTGDEQISFDLSAVPPTSGMIVFRLYFYDAPTTGVDWVDLLGTGAGGTGIVLEGPTGSSLGTPYCGPAPLNSTGQSGEMSASGSLSIAANDLVLRASGLPNNQFGIMVVSDTQGFVPGVGGTSNGNLCLGGAIGRYSRAGEILGTGSTGEFSFMIDALAIRRPTGNVPAMPGETWNFQAWHRDGVGLGSNFTDGIEVTFVN